MKFIFIKLAIIQSSLNLIIIPFMVFELCPLIYFKMASLWFSCSIFSIPWLSVLKCLYNVFYHKTQVKLNFGYCLYDSNVMSLFTLVGIGGLCVLWIHSSNIYLIKNFEEAGACSIIDAIIICILVKFICSIKWFYIIK